MRRHVPTAVVAVVAALVVLVLLFPASGDDSDPPQCSSALGYVVPCGLGAEQRNGPGFAVAGALLAAGLVVVGAATGGRARRSR